MRRTGGAEIDTRGEEHLLPCRAIAAAATQRLPLGCSRRRRPRARRRPSRRADDLRLQSAVARRERGRDIGEALGGEPVGVAIDGRHRARARSTAGRAHRLHAPGRGPPARRARARAPGARRDRYDRPLRRRFRRDRRRGARGRRGRRDGQLLAHRCAAPAPRPHRGSPRAALRGDRAGRGREARRSERHGARAGRGALARAARRSGRPRSS